jgi:hypothetical protein
MQIKYVEGICSECGLEKIIVHKSKKLCYLCLNKLRTQKYMKSSLEKKKEQGVSSKQDKEFYQQIWNERRHICYETGKFLGEKPSLPVSFYCHHILPKGLYPEFRYKKWNIILVHPDTHAQIESNIDKCPRVKQLTEELKLKYDERSIEIPG